MDISIWGHILLVVMVALRGHKVHDLSRQGDLTSAARAVLRTGVDLAVLVLGSAPLWSGAQIARVCLLVALPSAADRRIFDSVSPDAAPWLLALSVVISGLTFALFQWIR